MQINVINVSIDSPAGKKYQVAEVVYKDEGNETKTKKLMSFVNPGTYAALKDAKNGELFTITQVKNNKGYWDWTSATKAEAGVVKQQATSTGRSSYETPEERARRQVLIVKQSSLSSTVAMLAREGIANPTVEDVLTTAQQFADWVLADDQVVVEAAE